MAGSQLKNHKIVCSWPDPWFKNYKIVSSWPDPCKLQHFAKSNKTALTLLFVASENPLYWITYQDIVLADDFWPSPWSKSSHESLNRWPHQGMIRDDALQRHLKRHLNTYQVNCVTVSKNEDPLEFTVKSTQQSWHFIASRHFFFLFYFPRFKICKRKMRLGLLLLNTKKAITDQNSRIFPPTKAEQVLRQRIVY